MYLPILLTLFGFVFSVPLTSEDLRNDDLQARYVLPGESMPTLYDVQLYLDPNNDVSFDGHVSIRILPFRRTEELVLHAMETIIKSIEVLGDNGENIFRTYTLSTFDTHLLRIRLNRLIDPMIPLTINIAYSGTYAENLFGVYLSTYRNENNGRTERVITSQLQPTFARRAFPCYDEPHRKAVFRTTIYAPVEYPVVRSNMPKRTETDQLKPDVPGWIKHEFQDTLVMSTYLNAYLVSNFSYISNEDDEIFNVPFKVYSRPGTQEHAKFALEFGQKNMVALAEYTEIPYEFPKLDKVAVPDFAAGAMENWGLVIYREVALLLQEGVTTTAIRQNIARIITHENMHQWFGNEVSPLSWTFTWLNEGFANFFENYATDLVLPNFRMMDQFVLQMQGVMQNDAVLGVNPMTYPVFTPSQILGTFNAVAYQKSGSVIRMMQHFLTPEVFRKGLSIYIKDNARGAVGPSHLYAALQHALDESTHRVPFPLVDILNRWTNQGGFPVITVRRSSPQAQSVSVSQQRFLTDSTLSSNDRWHIPVNWVLSTDVDFEDTKPGFWISTGATATAIDIPGLSEAEWFIFNKKRTGYYRVNYNVENWMALAKVLNEAHETIDLLNRAQIIDDSFNLARNGRLNYVHPFEISLYLIKEKDYIPWASANTVFNYLDIVLSGSEVYDLFQYYMLNITAPLFEELGFNADDHEEHVLAFHRNNILNINCRHGNDVCIERAQELLQSFRNDPSRRLNPDIQTTVFCSGLRGGNNADFQFLWDLYLSSTDATEQSIYLNSLGCTTNEENLDFYLYQVINETSSVREQDRHTILVAVINSSPDNMETALDFIIEHFHEIQPRVQGLTGTTNILGALANRLNTEGHSDKMDEFESRHASIFTAAEIASVRAIRTNIAASINWSKNNLETVDAWLREHYGDGASAVTASLLLLVSCLFALFSHVQAA